MLLILSNSYDGTADILSSLCHRDELFRFNIDQWSQYDIRATTESIILSDPVGRRIDALHRDTLLLWRKPIPHSTEFEHGRPDRTVLSSQLLSLLRGIHRTLTPRRQVGLIEPESDNRLAKIFQLVSAKNYFAVPDWELSNLKSAIASNDVITKMLGNPQLPDGRIIYTTAVDKHNLARPFPWFLQETISNGQDITCVYIGGECFYFRSSYLRSAESLDWRLEINTEDESPWSSIPPEEIGNPDEKIRSLMQEWNLHYGRLDFILDAKKTLWFLECNPNGQFGWLDDRETLTLHKKFLSAVLNPDFRISNRE